MVSRTTSVRLSLPLSQQPWYIYAIIVNVYRFGNLGLLSAEGFLRLESIALVLIIYTKLDILTKSSLDLP